MSRAQRLLRFLYTLEVPRMGGAPVQAGAICWRRGDEGLEILLVTGRHSGKWGIPKGWALRGRPLHQTATREAWEEAGVRGAADNRLAGMVVAPKSYPMVGTIPWKLLVYPLEVRQLEAIWPEQGERKRRWFSREQAARQVRHKALSQILATFDPEP